MYIHVETGIVCENRKIAKKIYGHDRFKRLMKEGKLIAVANQ